MTRIETPLAAPVTDKPADKTIGKATSKDGDTRHAAFRSLMKQLGTPDKLASGTAADKDAKALPGATAKNGSVGNRAGTKDDKIKSALESSAPPQSEPSTSNEPVLTWQAILGSGPAEHPGQSPATAMNLSALVSAPAPESEAPTAPPEKPTAHQAADRLGRMAGMALPSNAGLDLTRGNATDPTASDTNDPFAALSSLLNRETDATAEPETVDVAPIKMSVVTRETHFEPVARLSPVQQITTAIGDELAKTVAPAPAETTSQNAEPTRHSSGPLKVLHVKLEPEDLGAVVLKMRLVDKSLELEVIASRQETADLLAKDRDTLTRVLRGSGYTTDVIAISTSTAPDSGQMTSDNQAGSQPSSGQAGSQTGGNRGSNDPAGSGGRPPARPMPMEGVTHEESGTSRSGGDLYL